MTIFNSYVKLPEGKPNNQKSAIEVYEIEINWAYSLLRTMFLGIGAAKSGNIGDRRGYLSRAMLLYMRIVKYRLSTLW